MLEASGLFGGYTRSSALGESSGLFGGYVFSRAKSDFFKTAILGGFTQTVGGTVPSVILGGLCLSVQLVNAPDSYIGGIGSGSFENEAVLGGYTFGHPVYKNYVETRARTLIKVRSESIVDQALNLDAQIVLKQTSNDNFNAKFIWAATSSADFNARFKVTDNMTVPTVQILSVSPASGVLDNGCKKVTIIASGILGTGTEWINTQIDFGDPIVSTNPRVFTPNMSISGFTTPPPWTTTHDYCASGYYIITVRGQDNKGMVGSTFYRLNLASGLDDSNFPKLSISAVPTSGSVPDSVLVQFSLDSSGVASPPFTAKQKNATNIGSVADRRILWNLGNREISQKRSPFTYYQSPGLYAPVLRYRFVHPSGGNPIWLSDTLLVGYNI